MKRTYILYGLFALLVGAGAIGVSKSDFFRLHLCRMASAAERFSCIHGVIDRAARTGDYLRAFDLVALGYELDAGYASDCHASVHEIGKTAYERFRDGDPATFTSQASSCGYGFYHGFMEQMFGETGDADEAIRFCDHLGRELYEETVDARGACFHGIGHGTVDGTYPQLWGDPRALAAQGIEMCELVAADLPDISESTGPLYRCVTGVYNSLEILSQDTKYELTSLAKDPFGFCTREPEPYREGCYTNMIPAALRIYRDDVAPIIDDMRAISNADDDMKARLIRDLMHEYVRLHLADGVEGGVRALPLCRALPAALKTGCVEGVSGGYLKYGSPSAERSAYVSFCQHDALSNDERDACYRFGLRRLRNHFSLAESSAICERVPEEMQRYCSDR